MQMDGKSYSTSGCQVERTKKQKKKKKHPMGNGDLWGRSTRLVLHEKKIFFFPLRQHLSHPSGLPVQTSLSAAFVFRVSGFFFFFSYPLKVQLASDLLTCL